MPSLLATLRARDLVHDATPGLETRLARGPVTAYVGFDPTADSLHVGSLLPVMALAWLQRMGGRPIALVGGGTGMVGDPSGKRAERPVLPVETIDANVAGLRRQLEHFLDFDGPAAARVMNNGDWLRPLGLMEFLRDTGKHFTIGYMLQKESVKSRLETGISFTEFSYMLVQAYDFWHLYRTAKCELQMGGSDQWGNITAGIELIGRREQGDAHGLVVPLFTTAGGGSSGKPRMATSGSTPRGPAPTSSSSSG
jgi:tyrosyl-tRNA synthetase